MFNKLAGKIREVFITQGAFAEAMGFSRSTLIQKMKGTVDWKTNEMAKACELLGIPLEEMHLYFF